MIEVKDTIFLLFLRKQHPFVLEENETNTPRSKRDFPIFFWHPLHVINNLIKNFNERSATNTLTIALKEDFNVITRQKVTRYSFFQNGKKFELPIQQIKIITYYKFNRNSLPFSLQTLLS